MHNNNSLLTVIKSIASTKSLGYVADEQMEDSLSLHKSRISTHYVGSLLFAGFISCTIK